MAILLQDENQNHRKQNRFLVQNHQKNFKQNENLTQTSSSIHGSKKALKMVEIPPKKALKTKHGFLQTKPTQNNSDTKQHA